MINLKDAKVITPSPRIEWRKLTDAERFDRVKDTLRFAKAELNEMVVIAAAKEDGQIIVNLVEPLSASKRGSLLLDFEAFLKESIDPSLVVWLEPLGDRNSLRKLRGIEVKA
jgi:hypothetical protein